MCLAPLSLLGWTKSTKNPGKLWQDIPYPIVQSVQVWFGAAAKPEGFFPVQLLLLEATVSGLQL